jgi:hypothetical protein
MPDVDGVLAADVVDGIIAVAVAPCSGEDHNAEFHINLLSRAGLKTRPYILLNVGALLQLRLGFPLL